MHYFFFIASIGDWVGTLAYQPLHVICKPLIIATLILYFWNAIGKKFTSFSRWIIGALFFSWAGDIFLLFEGKGFFIGGLGSFLLAHVLYLGAYLDKEPLHRQQTPLLARKPYLLLPFVAYLVGFYSFLYPHLNDLAIPVAVYAAVLTAMGVLALNRWNFTSEASFIWIAIGALFFIISDSLLSLNLFVLKGAMPIGNFLVMFTYTLAQYCIVRGSIKHLGL